MLPLWLMYLSTANSGRQKVGLGLSGANGEPPKRRPTAVFCASRKVGRDQGFKSAPWPVILPGEQPGADTALFPKATGSVDPVNYLGV